MTVEITSDARQSPSGHRRAQPRSGGIEWNGMKQKEWNRIE